MSGRLPFVGLGARGNDTARNAEEILTRELGGEEAARVMPDRAGRDRVIGGLAFAGSGIAFLVAVAFLYSAEGPGSPDILVTLASPAGRGLFNGSPVEPRWYSDSWPPRP